MATLPLPDIKKHEVIILHLSRSGDDRITLQIPSVDRKTFETYRLNLKDATHFSFVRNWNNGSRVLSELKLCGHVLYYPGTGEWMRMEEDSPAPVSRLANVIKHGMPETGIGAFPTLRSN
jgi:hypothetical protein